MLSSHVSNSVSWRCRRTSQYCGRNLVLRDSFYIYSLQAHHVQIPASVPISQNHRPVNRRARGPTKLTAATSRRSPHRIHLIIPNSLLPRLPLFALLLLPLPLLIPPLPLLVPHGAVKLPLLLGSPRRAHPQRPSDHAPRNRSRLLRPLVQLPGLAGAHATVAAQPPRAIGRVVWEVEGRGGRGCWWRGVRG